MLVLTREKDGVILIGNDIRITITEIRNNKVRIGVDAPKGVSIVRAEIAHLPAKDEKSE